MILDHWFKIFQVLTQAAQPSSVVSELELSAVIVHNTLAGYNFVLPSLV
jgi:hypothetical protein